MARVAEVDEPLAIDRPRHLLQQLDPPTVVLDEVVDTVERGGDLRLNVPGRQTYTQRLKTRLVEDRSPRSSRCKLFDLLASYGQMVVKEHRIDYGLVRHNRVELLIRKRFACRDRHLPKLPADAGNHDGAHRHTLSEHRCSAGFGEASLRSVDIPALVHVRRSDERIIVPESFGGGSRWGSARYHSAEITKRDIFPPSHASRIPWTAASTLLRSTLASSLRAENSS